jgi:hypothetical protein
MNEERKVEQATNIGRTTNKNKKQKRKNARSTQDDKMRPVTEEEFDAKRET